MTGADNYEGQNVKSIDPARIKEAVQPTGVKSLHQKYRRGNLTFLVGAGASMAAGLPSWTALNRRLINAFFDHFRPQLPNLLDSHIDFESEELKALQARFINEFGRDGVVDLLKRELGANFRDLDIESASMARFVRMVHHQLYKDGYELKPLHYELAAAALDNKRGHPNIYTTNFDDLLELAMERLRKQDVTAMATARDRPANGGPAIVHLHGYLPNSAASKGDLILSEKDFLATNESHFAKRELENLLEGSHVLFVGLSVSDPRLRTILYNRLSNLESLSSQKRHDIHVIFGTQTLYDEQSLVQRRADKIASLFAERYWEDWRLNILRVPNFTLIPVILRQIRLGPKPGAWVKKGVEFLKSESCYEGLYESGCQASVQWYLFYQHAFLRDKFEVPRNERVNIILMLPDVTKGRAVIQPAYQYVEDHRIFREGAHWTERQWARTTNEKNELEPDDLSLSIPFRLRYPRYDSATSTFYFQILDKKHARSRCLSVDSWDDVQGVSGFALLTGNSMDVGDDRNWLYNQFDDAQRSEWDDVRVFSSLLSVPVYDTSDWVPIGVACLTSTYQRPFWGDLSVNDRLNLERFLRSIFRRAVGYTSQL